MHRMRGVKISDRIFIGEEMYLQNEYPECIETQDEVVIALRFTMVAHLRSPGKIIIQKKAWIGSECIFAAVDQKMLTSEKGTALADGRVVTRDVLPCTLMGGCFGKIARVTAGLTLDTSYKELKNGLFPLYD